MLTRYDISTMTGAPVHTVSWWIKSGVRVGVEEHARTEFLRGSEVADVYAFIRAAWSHHTMRSVHSSVIAAAFQAAPTGEIPKRFRVAAPVA